MANLNQPLFKVGWADSCNLPSCIHLTKDGIDTLCGGHSEYLQHRVLARVPRKNGGYSKFCRGCFKDGGKSNPWYPKCKEDHKFS